MAKWVYEWQFVSSVGFLFLLFREKNRLLNRIRIVAHVFTSPICATNLLSKYTTICAIKIVAKQRYYLINICSLEPNILLFSIDFYFVS